MWKESGCAGVAWLRARARITLFAFFTISRSGKRTSQFTGMIHMLLAAKWTGLVESDFCIQHLVAGPIGRDAPVFHDAEIRAFERLVINRADKNKFHPRLPIPFQNQILLQFMPTASPSRLRYAPESARYRFLNNLFPCAVREYRSFHRQIHSLDRLPRCRYGRPARSDR